MTLIILIYFACGRLSFTVKPPLLGQIFLGIAPRTTQEVNVDWYYNAGLEFCFLTFDSPELFIECQKYLFVFTK